MLLLSVFIKQMLALALLQHVSKCGKVIMTCLLHRQKISWHVNFFIRMSPQAMGCFKVCECPISTSLRTPPVSGTWMVQGHLDFRCSSLTVTQLGLETSSLALMLQSFAPSRKGQVTLSIMQTALEILCLLVSWPLPITTSTVWKINFFLSLFKAICDITFFK